MNQILRGYISKSLAINGRQRATVSMLLGVVILVTIFVTGFFLDEKTITTDLTVRNAPPSFDHLFGTDWLGRDMFARTLKGLFISIGVGVIGAAGSTAIATLLGVCAAMLGKWVDRLISWLIDVFLSVPHLVTLILIAFTIGGGFHGIAIGIAVTHWPSLARVIRAEAMQIRSSDYVHISKQMGKKKAWIILHHVLPNIAPQILIGFILLFPHAILHEAAVTFLGFGISPHEPAIGIILSESMKYLSSGAWWLAFFPGLCLLFIVRIFDRIGAKLRSFIEPNGSLD
ncbi:ABC transporter permease [Metabacillus niabensis]|uniref:Peptide/nickel transport system permease protein n=1 Tax=Metabacillus niabensis TaxID=324854 RepID=A0ABT9YWM3_9BACI|nr:ABC transporter permease [Metabacillus niabensis]MDQ0224394.1 peptide/nickel transport system permease protein [Metabacillus niabensis]